MPSSDLLRFFEKPADSLNFEAVRISLASPEKIRSWSYGEVKKPETINYRTFKPERDGLFCAKIFGPVRDYECICGKYKRMKHRGIVCDKCGVEVIHSRVRRERLGHINLAAPVAHIWFLKSLPSRIGTILDITLKDVERVLYSESYVVTDPGNIEETKLKRAQVLSEDEYDEAIEKHGNGGFTVNVGAEALLELLKSIDVEDLFESLRVGFKEATSEAARKKAQKRLKVVESFLVKDQEAGLMAKPEWMMLEVVPVQPPDLRPLVPLDGGRFATSDLNDLYRRVINRNNRLQRLVELGAPDIIIRNEKRMLQESVDALFDNGRRGKVFTGPNKRPLRSLSDFLKGKQGRFRQNLLGKRVDYSGRSVIVVGPDLKLHQAGLPKKMAIEIFKPFLYCKLEEHGVVSTIKSAKKLVEKQHPEVWDILEEVTREHPILLNRAPTLHRLGIQAFEPLLIEGKAIRLHPLVCFAFNADFDGDQMAVHLPLSIEAQMEARVLMMSTNNVLSPASGSPVIVPSQDIVLGTYYLTREKVGDKGEGQVFSSLEEARSAYDHGEVGLQASVKVRLKGRIIQTTIGRALLSDLIPNEIPFDYFNKVVGKKELADLVDICFRVCGPKKTVLMADAIRTIGYNYSTKAGLSISIGDMIIPKEKKALLAEAESQISEINEQYSEGLLTNGERYNKVVDIWATKTERIAEAMFANIASEEIIDKKGNKRIVASNNSIFMMADSGARGSAQQIRQLAGMRGLMSKPSGEIIETPITANFREGLTVLQYFTSTHGARKGLADTALKTASSGYLTRRLVDVAQDAIVTETDCGVKTGVRLTHVREGSDIKVNLADRVLGRVVASRDIVDPVSGSVIVKVGDLVEESHAEKIKEFNIEEVEIRNVLSCKSKRGICANCYGRDLASGKLIDIGEAIGVIAAQSIGEPGTQLTMRTFHFGGTATHKVETNTSESRFTGKTLFKNLRFITNKHGQKIVLSRNGEIDILGDDGRRRDGYPIMYGSTLKVEDNSSINAGDCIVEWDPFSVPILSEGRGKIRFKELFDGKSYEEKHDDVTFMSQKVIIDSKGDSLKPTIELIDDEGKLISANDNDSVKTKSVYSLPMGCILNVDQGEMCGPGDIIAKIPREVAKTKDITGGLPRVAELFEARKPKEPSILVESDGTISFGEDTKGKRKVFITDSNGKQFDYLIPKGRVLLVNEGDYVRKGELLADGQHSPHDILRVRGAEALAEYLVNEIQSVYRLQGVKINDKHIEVISRQMMRRVVIIDAGDSKYLPQETASKEQIIIENKRLETDGLKQAVWEPLLLGITRASLSTESWISAASFQETTKVLTQASISSKVDHLRGLKENVIMGRLVPAGTGSANYENIIAAESSEKESNNDSRNMIENSENREMRESAAENPLDNLGSLL